MRNARKSKKRIRDHRNSEQRRALRDLKKEDRKVARLAANLKHLRLNLGKLSFEDSEFALSLINQFDQKKRLTEKQWKWIPRLSRRAKLAKRASEISETVSVDGSCFVYLFQADSLVKIGISKDPRRRAKDIQTSNGNKISVLRSVKFSTRQAARISEKRIHSKCRRFKRSGEWFSLEAVDVFNRFFSLVADPARANEESSASRRGASGKLLGNGGTRHAPAL